MNGPGRPSETIDRLEDLAWLLDAGETHAEAIAKRLGTTQSALKRYLERAAHHQPCAVHMRARITWTIAALKAVS